MEFKEKGNEFFRSNQFEQAINFYTFGLNSHPDQNLREVLYLNRALSQIKILEYDKSLSDCEAVLQFNHSSIKAHYFRGLALSGKKQYKNALESLKTSLRLSEKEKATWIQELKGKIDEVELLLFQENENQEKNYLEKTKNNLFQYLDELIRLRNQNSKNVLDIQDKMSELQIFFEKIQPKRPEIPSYFCCPISLDIMNDPVVGNSGVSYEKNAIFNYIDSGGNQDPITRIPINKDQFHPNICLRQAIEEFLEKKSLGKKKE
eukprot:Anaeramoba_ignava/a616645_6.p1 GENE.a616645_6~~a616645_6.p1  ORF type:complete len:269 (+),score=96.69 a616645_6:22-807(+)